MYVSGMKWSVAAEYMAPMTWGGYLSIWRFHSLRLVAKAWPVFTGKGWAKVTNFLGRGWCGLTYIVDFSWVTVSSAPPCLHLPWCHGLNR